MLRPRRAGHGSRSSTGHAYVASSCSVDSQPGSHRIGGDFWVGSSRAVPASGSPIRNRLCAKDSPPPIRLRESGRASASSRYSAAGSTAWPWSARPPYPAGRPRRALLNVKKRTAPGGTARSLTYRRGRVFTGCQRALSAEITIHPGFSLRPSPWPVDTAWAMSEESQLPCRPHSDDG